MSNAVHIQREIVQNVEQNLTDMGIPSPPPIVVAPPTPSIMILTEEK
jgi:hypothetical protein